MNSPAVLAGQRKILLGRRQQDRDRDGETQREKTDQMGVWNKHNISDTLLN